MPSANVTTYHLLLTHDKLFLNGQDHISVYYNPTDFPRSTRSCTMTEYSTDDIQCSLIINLRTAADTTALLLSGALIKFDYAHIGMSARSYLMQRREHLSCTHI